MASNKTTFGKLVCTGCGHKPHLGEICPRKDCGCYYPTDKKPSEEKIALPNGTVTTPKEVQSEYDAICRQHRQLERAGRYIPRVKIAQPKIEHESRRKAKTIRSSRHPTQRKSKRMIVEHKTTREQAAKGASVLSIKGRRA